MLDLWFQKSDGQWFLVDHADQVKDMMQWTGQVKNMMQWPGQIKSMIQWPGQIKSMMLFLNFRLKF